MLTGIQSIISAISVSKTNDSTGSRLLATTPVVQQQLLYILIPVSPKYSPALDILCILDQPATLQWLDERSLHFPFHFFPLLVLCCDSVLLTVLDANW
jgi:hypothetical protein